MTPAQRIPQGLVRCAECGEYRGSCRSGDLDWGCSRADLVGLPPEHVEKLLAIAETLRPPPDAVTTVSCLCMGIACPRCRKKRIHRPGSNHYDPECNAVGHYPWFWGMRGCDACNADARSAGIETRQDRTPP